MRGLRDPSDIPPYGDVGDGRSDEEEMRLDAGLVAGFIVIFLALGALCGAWRFLTASDYFVVRSVEVSGETEYLDVEGMKAALRSGLEGNYFTADLAKARRVAESFPWVESARVERVWPDQVKVRVSRRRVAAVWCGTRLLSDSGEIFAPGNIAAVPAEGLPRLSGPDTMSARVMEMYRALSRIADGMGVRMLTLEVTDRGAWGATVEGGGVPVTRIEFGRETAESGIPDRFALVAAHYREAARMLGGAPAVIDARYENAFAATVPPAAEDELMSALKEAEGPKGRDSRGR